MGNRIPRNFSSITATPLSGNAKGKQMIITKDEYGYHGREIESGFTWLIFISHLRNENMFRIDNIEL